MNIFLKITKRHKYLFKLHKTKLFLKIIFKPQNNINVTPLNYIHTHPLHAHTLNISQPWTITFISNIELNLITAISHNISQFHQIISTLTIHINFTRLTQTFHSINQFNQINLIKHKGVRDTSLPLPHVLCYIIFLLPPYLNVGSLYVLWRNSRLRFLFLSFRTCQASHQEFNLINT